MDRFRRIPAEDRKRFILQVASPLSVEGHGSTHDGAEPSARVINPLMKKYPNSQVSSRSLTRASVQLRDH